MVLRRINTPIPEDLKDNLTKMADELGLSVSQLTVMALHSLVANYQSKGSLIFADLLNPDHKKNKRT